ncbi:hypothetical protein [uncultured Rhodoblastus sp.]|uniref:hypothetical protein n=1 Tax=uncultured Rhodoblastus sp. TaxID=543037 RepID=UPI0025E5D1B3|nr:hypothetical protein [uncultured Rhodoblastus sp.]
MFAFSDSFLAGYMAGESATDRQKAIDSVWQGIDGRRQITVDQSYLDSLSIQFQNAQANAEHNHRIASEWITHAKKLEQENVALRSQVAALNRVTAERNGLLKFLDMAGHLLQAQREGKAARPEFAELREFALKVAGIHMRGEIYEGLADQPKKMARLREIWEALR